jgi:hypothetical protein
MTFENLPIELSTLQTRFTGRTRPKTGTSALINMVMNLGFHKVLDKLRNYQFLYKACVPLIIWFV